MYESHLCCESKDNSRQADRRMLLGSLTSLRLRNESQPAFRVSRGDRFNWFTFILPPPTLWPMPPA